MEALFSRNVSKHAINNLKMTTFRLFTIFLATFFMVSCSLNKQLSSVSDTCFELTRHVIYCSDKIVTNDLYISSNYCSVHFIVSPISLGASDGKGLRINYNDGQHYLFMAIDDDHPINLYDSQGKKNIQFKHPSININNEYEEYENKLFDNTLCSDFKEFNKNVVMVEKRRR